MGTEKILIVDDEEDWLDNCVRILRRGGYQLLTATNGAEAIQCVINEQPDLVLTDLRMTPGVGGIEVLKKVQQIDPDIVVILCTAYATYQTALESGREGAFDYLSKPLESSAQLQYAVERGLERRRLLRENRNLRQQLEDRYGFENIIGNSPAMEKVFDRVRKVAKSDASVLICGESGTGKELIARSLHINSLRANGPFVPLDCAALPHELLESELFGHEKGAFTGAHAAKPGLFETADTGTIFFDEIGEMPMVLQPKVLRVLQEKEFRRVGGRKQIQVNVRVLAATNRNLKREIEHGNFREDLYYRLNVILLELPPLRDRVGDVPLLAHHFLNRLQTTREKKVSQISEEAMRLLVRYRWPGNARELQNAIESAATFADGCQIQPSDLPASIREATSFSDGVSVSHDRSFATLKDKSEIGKPSVADADFSLSFKDAKEAVLESFEKEYLIRYLRQYHGNMSQTAAAAGIDRKTLYRLIRKHGIHTDFTIR